VLTGGAPPAPATIERLEGELGWEVIHVYGLTETSPFVALCEPRPEHAQLNLAERATLKARQGVPWLMTGQTLVVDDSAREVPHDGETLGEIVVRGNVVMRGYYKDVGATATAIHDGWFRTGDVAVVHSDGYMEIRDRRKDIIISGGENISSVEVEQVLLRHVAVQEAAVVGLPDDRWGEAPHAYVVLRSGADASEHELRQFARDNLAHFKAPHSVTFVGELPKTATGKIRKNILRGGRPALARQ
jgi:fatty-acyl-CoA synthase